MIVGGARLQDIDEGEAAMLEGCLENFCHLCDVSRKSACHERRLQREDEIHGGKRLLGNAIGCRIHRLPLPCKRARLAGGKTVVGIVVENKCEWIIAAN